MQGFFQSVEQHAHPVETFVQLSQILESFRPRISLETGGQRRNYRFHALEIGNSFPDRVPYYFLE